MLKCEICEEDVGRLYNVVSPDGDKVDESMCQECATDILSDYNLKIELVDSE